MTSITLKPVDLNAAQTLAAIAEQLPKVEFDPAWASGSYMDGAVYAELPEGLKVAAFTDNHNRIGVILKTTIGCLCIFQRYSRGQDGVVVSNCHRNLHGICQVYGFGSSVSKNTLFNTFAWMGDVDSTWYLPENTADFISVVDGIRKATLDDEE